MVCTKDLQMNFLLDYLSQVQKNSAVALWYAYIKGVELTATLQQGWNWPRCTSKEIQSIDEKINQWEYCNFLTNFLT